MLWNYSSMMEYLIYGKANRVCEMFKEWFSIAIFFPKSFHGCVRLWTHVSSVLIWHSSHYTTLFQPEGLYPSLALLAWWAKRLNTVSTFLHQEGHSYLFHTITLLQLEDRLYQWDFFLNALLNYCTQRQDSLKKHKVVVHTGNILAVETSVRKNALVKHNFIMFYEFLFCLQHPWFYTFLGFIFYKTLLRQMALKRGKKVKWESCLHVAWELGIANYLITCWPFGNYFEAV